MRVRRLLCSLILVVSSVLIAFPVDVKIPKPLDINPYAAPGTSEIQAQAEWTPTGEDTATITVKGYPPFQIKGEEVRITNERYANPDHAFLIKEKAAKHVVRLDPHLFPKVSLSSIPNAPYTANVELPFLMWEKRRLAGDKVEEVAVSHSVKAPLTEPWKDGLVVGSPVAIYDSARNGYFDLMFMGWSDGKAVVADIAGRMREKGDIFEVNVYRVPAHLLCVDYDEERASRTRSLSRVWGDAYERDRILMDLGSDSYFGASAKVQLFSKTKFAPRLSNPNPFPNPFPELASPPESRWVQSMRALFAFCFSNPKRK